MYSLMTSLSQRFSYNDEEKVTVITVQQYYNTMSSPDNSENFWFYLYVEYDTRWDVARAGFWKQNKETLIKNNGINK